MKTETHSLWRVVTGLLAAGVALIAIAGCNQAPTSHPGHSHGGTAATHHDDPAVQYKAGHGLKLNPAATNFVHLATGEVASRDFPSAKSAAAVPESAVLRTVRGDFVFVANGGWLLRTPVKLGAADAGWRPVLDGLYEGDTVVTRGVSELWLAEIQAVNGGVGCADGH